MIDERERQLTFGVGNGAGSIFSSFVLLLQRVTQRLRFVHFQESTSDPLKGSKKVFRGLCYIPKLPSKPFLPLSSFCIATVRQEDVGCVVESI